jgi:hypothetical protein
MSEPTPNPPVDLGDLAAELERQGAELGAMRLQLDHIDTMVHELLRFVADNRPALERATNLLDSGRPMRAWLDNRKATRNGT